MPARRVAVLLFSVLALSGCGEFTDRPASAEEEAAVVEAVRALDLRVFDALGMDPGTAGDPLALDCLTEFDLRTGRSYATGSFFDQQPDLDRLDAALDELPAKLGDLFVAPTPDERLAQRWRDRDAQTREMGWIWTSAPGEPYEDRYRDPVNPDRIRERIFSFSTLSNGREVWARLELRNDGMFRYESGSACP